MTDDSELAFCLLQGLLKGSDIIENDSNVLDTNSIALFYRKWIKSNPFDVGRTTENALDPLKDILSAQRAKSAAKIQNANS